MPGKLKKISSQYLQRVTGCEHTYKERWGPLFSLLSLKKRECAPRAARSDTITFSNDSTRYGLAEISFYLVKCPVAPPMRFHSEWFDCWRYHSEPARLLERPHAVMAVMQLPGMRTAFDVVWMSMLWRGNRQGQAEEGRGCGRAAGLVIVVYNTLARLDCITMTIRRWDITQSGNDEEIR